MKNALGEICNINFLPLILFFIGLANISAFQPEFYWKIKLLGIEPSSTNQNQESFKPGDYQVEFPSEDVPSDEPHAWINKNRHSCIPNSEISYIENEMLKTKRAMRQTNFWMDISLLLFAILAVELTVSAVTFLASWNKQQIIQIIIEFFLTSIIAYVILTVLAPIIVHAWKIDCGVKAQISAELIKITWVGQESLVIGVILVCLAFAVLILRNTTFRHQRFFVERKAKQDGQDE